MTAEPQWAVREHVVDTDRGRPGIIVAITGDTLTLRAPGTTDTWQAPACHVRRAAPVYELYASALAEERGTG